MSVPSFNPDRRPLSPNVASHYDPHRGIWLYVHLRSNPPRISYIHPADEVAQNQQQASSQPQQTVYPQTSPQQQAGYQPQPQPQKTIHTQTSFPQQQNGYQPQPQQTIPTQTSFPQQQNGYQPQPQQTIPTQTSFPQQQEGYQPRPQPQPRQTIHTQTSFSQQQAGYQPQPQPQTRQTIHTQTSFPQQQPGYQPQPQQTIPTQTPFPQQQGGYQPQQTIHTQTPFPQQQGGYQPQQQQTIYTHPQQQAGYQPQQQTIHTQTSFPQHQQSYQTPSNGTTPFARVFHFRKGPSEAQQLYSSAIHPPSSQSSPEDEPRHLFPTNGHVQYSPQSLEFDPYSLYSSTSPSTSTNPSTQVSPTSMSPTIQPPEVHSSGYSTTRSRRRPSINGTPMGSRSFTDDGGENFRENSLFEPAPMRSNSMMPRVLDQPINIRPRHLRSATAPPVAPVATNGLPTGVFMKPKDIPVYSLTARPPSFLQQTSQPTSPQDLPLGAAAPWMVGGISTNPGVPVLAPTSPNGVVAQPMQNVVQKALPLAPPQPQVQSTTNGKATSAGVTIGKKVLKATAKAALGTVMPSSIANLAVNATAAGIETAIKVSKKPKAPEVQQPGPNTALAQLPVPPLYPNPAQFYQQTQQFANSQLQQPQQPQYGVVAQVQRAATQMPPQRQSSGLINSIAGAATRAVVSSAMDAAFNTEPSSGILSIFGDE